MDPLFSHAPRPEGDATAEGAAPPSRVVRAWVPAPRDVAYSAFVGDLHLWWPSSHTGFGEGTHPFLEDGLIGEEGPEGQLRAWGTVTAEVPGSLLELDWTLAGPVDAPTRVRAEFSDEADGTAVVLTQDGWAAGREGRTQYEKYGDWALILGRFAAFFGQPAGSVDEE